MTACAQLRRRRDYPGREHRLAAALALAAIVLALLAIPLAGVAVHGTAELAALAESAAQGQPAAAPPAQPRSQRERGVDEAVATSRFATGLSP